MGVNVLSLFDGMSCGHLALDAAGIEVDSYVASEVKDFAVAHTRKRYPDTIEAGDVTALHYENGKLYRDCKRWCMVKDLSILKGKDYVKNKDLIKEEGGLTYIDIVHMEFPDTSESILLPGRLLKLLPFDRKNEVLAKYKDSGLFLNAKDMPDDEADKYISSGHEVLPNGEIVKWEKGEEIFEGKIDLLIGGSPCTNFSVACSPHHKKYGLEGPKSRLFFDYLRLLKETDPRYFFFENVKMREESRKALDEYLGVSGVEVNSRNFSFQNRVRLYWTNIPGEVAIPDSTEKMDFQNRKLKTIPRMEWSLYVNKFPGSFFGYAEGTPEYAKEISGDGKFTFDDIVTDDTNRVKTGDMLVQIEGTKDDIVNMVNFTEKKYNKDDKTLGQTAKHAALDRALVPDLSFSNEEASFIAKMNAWARHGYELLIGRGVTDREFADEIHKQLSESLATKSPSRDSMRYGRKDGAVFSSPCADITYSEKVGCLTRKQDRLPNAGNIAFGPYYRFLTKFELCEAQTVPYEAIGDLSYGEVQDVCGDGWTVDVVAGFFSLIEKDAAAYNDSKTNEIRLEKNPKQNEEETGGMSAKKVSEVFRESKVNESKESDGLRAIPRGFYKVRAVQISVPDDDQAILRVREALRPWETGFDGEVETKADTGIVDNTVTKVLAAIERVFDKESAERVKYELYGFDIEKTSVNEAPDFVVEDIKAKVKEALKTGEMDESVKKKVLWLMG